MVFPPLSFCHSGAGKAGARKPYDAQYGFWTSAVALSGMTALLIACEPGDPDGDCNTDGGVWDAENRKCFCSYTQQGTYEDEPSTEQLEWRDWCADKSNLESIRTSATPPPHAN